MIRVDHHCEYHLVGDPAEWDLVPVPAEMHVTRKLLRPGEPSRGVFFAGPWIGEFGWELARWQGAVRKQAQETGLYTIVMSDPGHQVLYADFAHEFWNLPDFFLDAVASTEIVRHCDHVRPLRSSSSSSSSTEPGRILADLGTLLWRELNLTGDLKHFLEPTKFTAAEQHVVPLRVPGGWSAAAVGQHFLGYYCILPRFRTWNNQKNWPAANWRTLISRLTDLHLSGLALGRPEEVRELIPSFEMEPEEQLARSIDLLTHAKFAIAPESGGALLSLLCGCPTLVFGHHSQRKRITETENFLGTRVRYLARPDYNFSIEEVFQGALAIMRDL